MKNITHQANRTRLRKESVIYVSWDAGETCRTEGKEQDPLCLVRARTLIWNTKSIKTCIASFYLGQLVPTSRGYFVMEQRSSNGNMIPKQCNPINLLQTPPVPCIPKLWSPIIYAPHHYSPSFITFPSILHSPLPKHRRLAYICNCWLSNRWWKGGSHSKIVKCVIKRFG